MVPRKNGLAVGLTALWLLLAFIVRPGAAAADPPVRVAARGLVLPTAVAPYGPGRYVVADAALQRIFLVSDDGTTALLAGGGTRNAVGSVPGAYADGKGVQARFNAPQGIAVDASRDVYVTDTGNHCIRRIAPDGTVTTLAGDPARAGHQDGSGTAATFSAPRGIVLDVNGDLIVADSLVGVRRVTPAGVVTTVQVPVNSPLDVTFVIGIDKLPAYVFSDIQGLVIAYPDRTFVRFGLENALTNGARGTAGAPLGNPYSIAGYGSHTVVYTDRFSNVVRTIDISSSYVRRITGEGRDAASPLSEPLGLRLLSDHRSVAIADAGNRRLTVVHLDTDRDAFSPRESQLFPDPVASSRKRIALLGTSMIWWATAWADSIEGRAEAILNGKAGATPVEVMPILETAATADAQLSYAAELCDAHRADVVAINMTTAVLQVSYKFDGPASAPAARAVWQSRLRAAIEPVAKNCRSDHVPFVVVLSPVSNEVSSNEDALRRLLANQFDTDPDVHADFLTALRGLPLIDVWPAFTLAEEANGGDHPALYLTSDAHLSAAGRAVFATAFAAAIGRFATP